MENYDCILCGCVTVDILDESDTSRRTVCVLKMWLSQVTLKLPLVSNMYMLSYLVDLARALHSVIR